MTPRPGDFFTTATGGWVAQVIRAMTGSPVNHTGIYLGGGEIIEGEPKGAQKSPVRHYPHAIWSHIPLTDGERAKIVRVARSLEGTPYNYLDIAAIAISIVLGQRTPNMVRRRLSRPDRMICSQLVDYCYLQAGVHLFSDGRLPSEVTPGDLYRRNGAQ